MAPGAQVDRLYRAEFRTVRQFIFSQSPSFWLVCLYLFFEYVRPQDIYPSLSGRSIPFWTIILGAVSFVLEGARGRSWSIGDALMALFTCVVLASSTSAWDSAYAFSQFSLFGSWLLVYLLITAVVNSERRLFVFLLLYFIYNMKMTQHGVRSWADGGFGFLRTGVTCAPSYFHNSGECGLQMAMLFPLSLLFLMTLRPFWSKTKFWIFAAVLPAGAAVTIIASSSRGAMLALAGVGLWFVLRSKRRVKAMIGIGVLAGALYAMLPAEQLERFHEAGTDQTSELRLTYWKDGLRIMNNHPTLGIGYKNWLPYYRRNFNPIGEVPHNIFIEAGAELGYAGLIAFVALIGGTVFLNFRTRRMLRNLPTIEAKLFTALAHGLDGALIAYLIAGFFVTVLYYPFFWINFSMTVALANVAARHARRRGADLFSMANTALVAARPQARMPSGVRVV